MAPWGSSTPGFMIGVLASANRGQSRFEHPDSRLESLYQPVEDLDIRQMPAPLIHPMSFSIAQVLNDLCQD